MPTEPPSRPADRLHDYVGFVRSRLHEELARDGLHHSTRRALQRRLTRVGEIADQADGTAPASLMGRVENVAYLVNLAQRWRDHPAYPGTRRPAQPDAMVHTYRRGITADLLHKVGGYAGLTAEARTALAEWHPCRSDAPDAELAVVFETDDEAFVTVRAEIPCTDPRCRALADARLQAERDYAAARPGRLRALVKTVIAPHLGPAPDEPAEITHTWEIGYNAELLRESGGVPRLIKELREELTDTYPCRHDAPDAELPVTVTTNTDGFTTVETAFRCTDARCLAQESTSKEYDALADLVRNLNEQMDELLPVEAHEHLAEAERLLVPPLLPMFESNTSFRTIAEWYVAADPARLRSVWAESRHAVQAQLRALVEAIEPHAAPAA